jgi:hypothetical protein
MVSIINKAIELTQSHAKIKKNDVNKVPAHGNKASKDDWSMSADDALRASTIESYK